MGLLVLVGPTGSGKTQAAYEISKRLPMEMISCDSMQVYRFMPVVTQAPSAVVSRALRAHLVDFLDPAEEYSAARFREEAEGLISQIEKRKRTPVIVGGTGLYLRALLDGLFEPGTGVTKDESLRKKLSADQEKHGGHFLHDRLKTVDKKASEKIHPNDIRRIIRALEVYHLTQKPISEQHPRRKGIRERIPHRIFLLDRKRDDLYARIDARSEAMVDDGLVGEVKKLLKKKLGKTARMALGVREIESVLEGKSTLEEAKELLKKNTRRYAKRQLSWFRHERGVENVPIGSEETPAETADKILKLWSNA
ncbi:MAG: tRNA (adenosine(37)-N6)-dimethylallyltransferase MiaA [Candidatus Omnitrophica bacterium]|nr:tRNA (adenosine(37)-N6)-dimethylallyltransferase MiaA [Candidatus Omnitrophota bacterium]